MVRNQRINIESTPTSRWGDRYRKRYGYNFYGSIIVIGVIISLFGGFIIGIPMIIVGGYMIRKHHKYHNKSA